MYLQKWTETDHGFDYHQTVFCQELGSVRTNGCHRLHQLGADVLHGANKYFGDFLSIQEDFDTRQRN
jgi:hypothetical protein